MMEKKRKVGTTVVGIVAFIVAINTLLVYPFWVAGYQGFIFNGIILIALVSLGIFILKLRNWARILFVFTSWSLTICLFTIFSLEWLRHRPIQAGSRTAIIGMRVVKLGSNIQIPVLYWFLLVTLLFVIMPLLISSFYLTRPKVKEQFK